MIAAQVKDVIEHVNATLDGRHVAPVARRPGALATTSRRSTRPTWSMCRVAGRARRGDPYLIDKSVAPPLWGVLGRDELRAETIVSMAVLGRGDRRGVRLGETLRPSI